MSAGAPLRHQTSGRSRLGLALALTTVALWSVLPIGLKIALTGMDALTLTWYRFVGAGAVLGTILAARGGLPRVAGFDGRLWSLLAVATVFLCGNYVLYVVGLAHTNAGTAQVVIQLAPLLLAAGGAVVYREPVGAQQLLGFVTVAVGLLLFSHEQIAHLMSDLDRYYRGLAAIVLAAVSWALYGLAQKQLLVRLRSPQVLLCLYVGGALLFAPFATPSSLLALSGTEILAFLFCVANMLIAYGTFVEALVHLEASRVSAVLAMVPLSTLAAIAAARVVMPDLVAPEPLTGPAVAGAAMVVAGSLAAALRRS